MKNSVHQQDPGSDLACLKRLYSYINMTSPECARNYQ